MDLTPEQIQAEREYCARLQQIKELQRWFDNDYRTYCEMFTRRNFLQIEDTIVDNFRNKTYHNLRDLYIEAENVATEIKNLRNT